MDKRIKPMGRDDFISKNTSSKEVMVNEAQKWIEDYQSRMTGTTFQWSKQKAKEFQTTPIETLIRDPYFLGMGDQVYDGVLEDIIALFEERKRREIHLAIFQEGIGCLNPDNSWIWNESGLTRLNDVIKSKDKSILNQNGLTKVLGYKKEVKTTYRVITRAGFEFECSQDHPFLTLSTSGVPKFIKCKSLNIKTDFIGFKLSSNHFGKEEIPLDLAWALGILIGDGCITKNISVTSHYNDIIILEEIKIILEKYFGCLGRIKPDSRRPNNYHIRFNRVSELRSFLKDQGIFGKNTFFKTIPESVLKGTKEVWAAFLSGYFDSEGSSNKKGNVTITSVSKLLLQQTQLVLLNFGIISFLNKKKTTWNRGLRTSFTWRLKLSDQNADHFYNKIGFRLVRKQIRQQLLNPEKFNTNIDTFPNQSNVLYSVWNNSNLTQKGFKTIINSNYHQSPSRDKLRRFVERYKDSKDLCGLEFLNRRLDENIYWDQIRSIEIINDKELMDISVAGDNTYIANGAIHHNSGKTTKASILMWLSWFHLCCLEKSPQLYYDLAPNSIIALMMFSRSERQSRQVTFTEVWNRFQSPFNKDYFPPSERYSREIRISANNTCIFAGTSSALSALGYNLYGGVIDEAAYLESIEDSNKAVDGNYDAAEEMYQAIYNRMLSRFMKKGKLPGLIAMVSSPQFPEDFMSRKIAEAQKVKDSGIFWRRRSTWEAKGVKFFPEEQGHFFIDTETSEIISDINTIKFLKALGRDKFPLNLDLETIARISPYFHKTI